MHPQVKQIIPSHDINKNFKLISFLKSEFEEIELMVNEGCLQGCPHRNLHEISDYSNNKYIKNDIITNTACYSTLFCHRIRDKYPIHSFVISNIIFPWDLEEYKKIGISKFKLVGREIYNRFNEYINNFKIYLKGVDNFKNIENEAICTFIYHLAQNPDLQKLMVKDCKNYLPNINYFKKYGHLCASRCGVDCRYCYKCAEKIEKVYKKKIKEKELHYVHACKMT